MLRNAIISLITVLTLSAMGVAGVAIYGTMDTAKLVDCLTAVDGYFASDSNASTLSIGIIDPQYGGTISMLPSRPYNNITGAIDVMETAIGVTAFTVTVNNDGTIDVAENAANGVPNTFTISASGLESVTAHQITLPYYTYGNGVPAIFVSNEDAYLGDFLKGFLDVRDSSFMAQIDAMTATEKQNLVTALFDYDPTTIGDRPLVEVTRPNLYALRNKGSINNAVTKEKDGRLFYLSSTEKSRAVIDAVLQAAPCSYAGTEVWYNDLVNHIMQLPKGPIWIPAKEFQVHERTGLPLVRLLSE